MRARAPVRPADRAADYRHPLRVTILVGDDSTDYSEHEPLNQERVRHPNAARIDVKLYGAPSGVSPPSVSANFRAARFSVRVVLTHHLMWLYSPSSLNSHSDTFQWFQFLCPLYIFSVLLLWC